MFTLVKQLLMTASILGGNVRTTMIAVELALRAEQYLKDVCDFSPCALRWVPGRGF